MVLQLGQQRQQVLWLWDLQALVGGAQQSKQLLHLQAGVVRCAGAGQQGKWQRGMSGCVPSVWNPARPEAWGVLAKGHRNDAHMISATLYVHACMAAHAAKTSSSHL